MDKNQLFFEVDLKDQVEELLNLTRNSLIDKNLKKLEKTLILLKERLEYCGHCNGSTYEDGTCFEHFVE